METTCPHCGFVSREENPRFCSSCGARMDGSHPSWTAAGPAPEQKSAMTAGLCSSFLPGLGQVYNGYPGRAVLLFLFTLAGLAAIIIPGLLIWLYAVYDAYTVAGMMNAGTVPYRPADPIHVILFLIFAAAVIVIAVMVILWLVYTSLTRELGPQGSQYLNMLL